MSDFIHEGTFERLVFLDDVGVGMERIDDILCDCKQVFVGLDLGILFHIQI